MRQKFIPLTTISRLSLYLRELEQLKEQSLCFISSFELSRRTGISDAQIRRDLNYFGKFGKTKLGYSVKFLSESIRKILGIDNRKWNVLLIGIGNLGKALFSYKGFRDRGFLIKAIFDSDPKKIGKRINGIKIENIKNLTKILKTEKFDIAILAIPPNSAQDIANELVQEGVRAILNFAPARLILPPKVFLRNIDLSMELENLSFYLSKLK